MSGESGVALVALENLPLTLSQWSPWRASRRVCKTETEDKFSGHRREANCTLTYLQVELFDLSLADVGAARRDFETRIRCRHDIVDIRFEVFESVGVRRSVRRKQSPSAPVELPRPNQPVNVQCLARWWKAAAAVLEPTGRQEELTVLRKLPSIP